MPRSGVFGGAGRLACAPQRVQLVAPGIVNRRGAVQVVAAEAAAQDKKRTPQPEKRAELSMVRRSRNRSRKSAIATRTKKVGRETGDGGGEASGGRECGQLSSPPALLGLPGSRGGMRRRLAAHAAAATRGRSGCGAAGTLCRVHAVAQEGG
jgi:hypothetical protein